MATFVGRCPPPLRSHARGNGGSGSTARRDERHHLGGPSIGAVDCAHERQADAVADAVMAGTQLPPITAVSHALDRKSDACCEACEEEDLQRKAAGTPVRSRAAAAARDAAAAVASGGRPLSGAERRFFEPRFTHDFSHVRVHDGVRAAAAARSINARAYTVGPHIAFASGEYRPHHVEGRRLMAHELAHTVQQENGPIIRRTCPSNYQYDFYSDELEFEERVDDIQALPEFEALSSKGESLANHVIDGARGSACPFYYIERLQELFAAPVGSAGEVTSAQQAVIGGAEKAHGSRDIYTEMDEAKRRQRITDDPNRRYERERAEFGITARFGDSYLIDRTDPRNVVVALRVRLVPQGTGTQSDVDKTKDLEKAIEERASTTGYTFDIEFVDAEGPGVVTVAVDTSRDTVADNWVGDPGVIAHEAHHILRLEDRYDYLVHRKNPQKSHEDRLFWFREQMVRSADPLAQTSFMDDSHSTTASLQDMDVCALVVGDSNDPAKFGQCLSDRATLWPSEELERRGRLLVAVYEPRMGPLVRLLRDAWKKTRHEECRVDPDPYCEDQPPADAFGSAATIDADAAQFNDVVPNPHRQPTGASLPRKRR